MTIRTRAILIIILTNLLIVLFSVLAGISYVKKNIERSQELSLSLVAEIADRYISSEIGTLKWKLSEAVQSLGEVADGDWSKILTLQSVFYPEFIGMAVFDADLGLVLSSGESPPTPEIIDDKHIKQAFYGKTMISSTKPTPDGVMFYLAAPFPFSQNRILVVTLPGMHFSELLSSFVVWETGHIFIDDSDGYVIANVRAQWVQSRLNYIHLAQTDKQYEEIGSQISRMISRETGVGYFSVSGVPRVCAFRPVTGSEEGWCMGVIAPLPESPVRNIDKGLLVVALVSIFLNIIFALIASNFIKKPFAEIAALKEAAESTSKYKTQFLATMSHEIRTPINVVLGVTETHLMKEDHTKEAREAFESIFDSSNLLLHIINDILDLSKIEAGKFELIPVKYEASSLINDAVSINMMRFGHKQNNFTLLVDENLPFCLFGDELRIKQILNNLLSNAFKYTDAGNVELSFTSEKMEQDEIIMLVIRVSDSGQGMTPEQVTKLFDEYSRFNLEANRTTIGTGLGMSITRNLIKMMNGDISVKSKPGEGSTFTVRIPQGIAGSGLLGKDAAENLQKLNFNSATREKRTKINREPMPYGKVLIVDDIKSNLDVAKLLLKPYNLQVDTAGSGFEAIDMVKSGKIYHIIFMDHMMPKMDGIETTKILRDGGYKEPIFALTANAVAGQQDVFLANGFDGYISKPIDLRQLNEALNKFVRDKERDRQNV